VYSYLPTYLPNSSAYQHDVVRIDPLCFFLPSPHLFESALWQDASSCSSVAPESTFNRVLIFPMYSTVRHPNSVILDVRSGQMGFRCSFWTLQCFHRVEHLLDLILTCFPRKKLFSLTVTIVSISGHIFERRCVHRLFALRGVIGSDHTITVAFEMIHVDSRTVRSSGGLLAIHRYR
jgi:hypothetical protein